MTPADLKAARELVNVLLLRAERSAMAQSTATDIRGAAACLSRLADEVERLERDAARWQAVEAMMVHQRSGPHTGWTIDTLLPGDSPTDAIDAAIKEAKG